MATVNVDDSSLPVDSQT